MDYAIWIVTVHMTEGLSKKTIIFAISCWVDFVLYGIEGMDWVESYGEE